MNVLNSEVQKELRRDYFGHHSIIAARYESGSIVLTTNRPFREWGAPVQGSPEGQPKFQVLIGIQRPVC